MKSYFVGLVVVLLLALAAHGLLMTWIAYRGSAPVEAEYWVGDEIVFKKLLADRAGAGPRVLILSGSSGLFGIDSSMIERRTGFRTINLSTHGGLSLNFLLDFADRIVRAGDLIIMPLEYEYYQRPPDRFAEGSWPLALAVFPDVFRNLSIIDRLRLLARLEPRMIWDGAYVSARRVVQRDFMQQRSSPDPQIAMSKWKGASHAGPTYYGVEGTDEHGDIERNCESKNSDWSYTVAKGSYEINMNAVDALTLKAEIWKARGAKVFVSFPSVSNDVKRTAYFDEHAERLVRVFEEARIDTLGRPGDFVFPRKAFFDRRYHLNCDARIKRTMILIRSLMSSHE